MPEQPLRDRAVDRSRWHLTTTRARLETVAIYAVFALYVVFALKLLLFSRPPGSERSINLVPFATVSHYLVSGASGVRRFAFGNVAGNVLLFVPLGAYLSVLTRWTVARSTLVVASASVAVEILQGAFALGASDVDDVILNGLGGFIGVLLVLLARVVLKDTGRVRGVVAAVSVVALPVLCFLLFVVRLRM